MSDRAHLDDDVRRFFTPLFVKHGVQLVLAGHDHNEVGVDEFVLHAVDATGVEFDSMVVPR